MGLCFLSLEYVAFSLFRTVYLSGPGYVGHFQWVK